MKTLKLAAILFASLSTQLLAATFNSAPKVDSIEDLTNRVVSTSSTVTTPYVEVARFSSGGLYWDKPRIARLDLASTKTIVHGVVEPTSTGVGRWIFDDAFSGDPINVKWFGAVGTNSNVNDDTAAIQAALNFATNFVKLGGQGSASAHATFGGLQVTMPAGNYFYSQIGWPSDVAVRGEGPQRTTLKRLSGQSGNATYAINGDGQRLNLADFSIDGSWMAGTNIVNTNGHGLFLARTNYPNTVDGWPTIRNVYIYNCPQSGLYVGRYEGSGFAGIGGMRGAQVEGCHFFANGEYGLVVDSTDGVYRDNYYYNNGLDGVYIRASAVMNQFVGGRSYFNARHGLYAAGLQFNPIKGLSLLGFRSDQNGRTNTPGSGIFLTNVWESSLSGVIAFGNTLNGIDVHKSTDIHVSGAAVEFDYGVSDYGVQQYGVYIASTSTNIIADVAISSGHSSNAVFIGNPQTSRALIREPNSVYGDLRVVGVTRAFGDLELQNDVFTNGPPIRMASVTDHPAATLFIWDESNQRFILIPQAGSNYVNLYIGGFGSSQTNTRPAFINGDTPQAGKATNEVAQPMYFYAPRGTGSGSIAGSSFRFNTAVAGASGTALQSTIESARIDSSASGGTASSLLLHDGSSLQRLLIGTDAAKLGYFGATTPTEMIQDLVAAMMLTSGTNISINYNDAAGTLTFTVIGASGGTNVSGVYINGSLINPPYFTNNLSSDAGRIVWYINGSGHIVGYATNLSAGGSSSNTVVFANGSSVTNPNFTNTDANITLTIGSSTNIIINLATNIAVDTLSVNTIIFSNAVGVVSGGTARSNLTSEAYLVGQGTNAVKLVGPITDALAGWVGGNATSIVGGSGITITGGTISATGGTNLSTVLVSNTAVVNPNFVADTNTVVSVTSGTNIAYKVRDSGVTPNTYSNANITVGADGRIITASNGTAGTGSGETNTASNLGTQSSTVQGLYKTKSGTDLQFRSVEAGTGINLTSNANTVVISATSSGSFTVSTNNLGYLARSAVSITNTEVVGELSHYTITIPANILGVDGDELEIHVPGTFNAYTTGTNSAYTTRWSLDSASGGPDNMHVVSMSSTYFTQTSTDYSLDWLLRVKRLDSNTVFATSRHMAGPHYDSGSTNLQVSALGSGLFDISGDLGTDPIDITLYTDIVDDTRAARLKTFGYLVGKVGSLGQTNFITSVSSDFQVSGGALSLTNTTGSGAIVRQSAAGAWDIDATYVLTNVDTTIYPVYTNSVPDGVSRTYELLVAQSGATNGGRWKLFAGIANRAGTASATNWIDSGGAMDTNALAYLTNSGTNLLVMARGPLYQPQNGRIRGSYLQVTNAGAYAYVPTLDTNGLLLVWRFDEGATGDRTSSDANALVLTSTNTVGFSTSGVRSNAAHFSRASSQSLGLLTTNLVEVQTNLNFSLTAWVNPSSFPSSGQIYGIATKTDPGVNARVEYALTLRYFGASEFEFNFLTGTNGAGAGTHAVVSSTRGTATNQWYMVACGRDAAAGSNWISVAGSPKEWVASPGPGPTATPFRVGLYGSATHFFNGRIDEVTFWKTNITSAHISFLTNNPPPTLP